MRLLLSMLVLSWGAMAADPFPHHYIDYGLMTGDLKNTSEKTQTTYSEVIKVEGATWLRLFFDKTTQLTDGEQNAKTVLKVTSLKDGHSQILNAETLAQWRHSTAYFNGDAVRVELISDAGAKVGRFGVNQIMVGEPRPKSDPESICGPDDDRELSTDPRAARLFPVGCTAWLIDDTHQCYLSAGHCFDGGAGQVAQFNVPLSNGDGSLNAPPPEDQYLMDDSSLQWDLTVIGNDWAYFGTFRNAQTGLTAGEAAGSTYTLGTPPTSVGGETIRITGYGSVSGTQGNPVTYNQVQTTHTGPLTNVAGTVLQYATDTTGGNSGSAVVVEETGEAIGIHTNAGCSAGGGANQGTSLANTGLQAALASPLGVCLNGPPAPSPVLAMVSNAPDPVNPAGGESIQITINDLEGDPMTPARAELLYFHGTSNASVPFSNTGGANWSATLPAMSCGEEVQFQVEVESDEGGLARLPFGPGHPQTVRYVHGLGTFDGTFSDNMETDMGWTTDDEGSLTAGTWERGTPNSGQRNDPPYDADGSGQAYLTELGDGNTDVDGGYTRLVSPTMDATDPDSVITYWVWYSVGGDADDDFTVEVSDDDGGSWTLVETIPNPGTSSWEQSVHKVSDYVGNTNQFKIRFTASDTGAGSVVEAGVDSVKLYSNFDGLLCDFMFSDTFGTE